MGRGRGTGPADGVEEGRGDGREVVGNGVVVGGREVGCFFFFFLGGGE